MAAARRTPKRARSAGPPVSVLLGVTGGIAAYKSLELVRLFRKAGWQVTVAMTRHARKLVGPESFATLSGNPVALDLFPGKRPAAKKVKVEHVDLAASADLVVVAPATANILGKLANGVADDLLSTLLLAVPGPTLAAGRVILAPAMNTHMWQSPSVRRNADWLAGHGYRLVGPGSGELACGDTGPGRLPPPEVIFEACSAALDAKKTPRLDGVRVLVTTGRTEEPIDPVRVLTNRSSGRMGVEIARAFRAAGADTRLIAGPVSVPLPPGVPAENVTTTDEMHDAVIAALPDIDILVMCAAVADYRPATVSRGKRRQSRLALALERTPDILKAVSRATHHATVIGFSHDPSVATARAKLKAKRLDLIVANPFATAGSDTIKPTLVRRTGRSVSLKQMTKQDFARRLVAESARMRTTRPRRTDG